MPVVKYGIFIENTFISYSLQALVMFNHFLSDLITIIAILCASSYLSCHLDALIGKGNKALGRGPVDKVLSLQA